MVAINMGFTDGFMKAWLVGSGIGFLVALPISFLVPMLVEKICDKLFGKRALSEFPDSI
jgi:hypothetical protein